MNCPFCSKPLPNDSDFCQYCGKKIIIPKTHSIKSYCKRCGGEIDSNTETCISCGKKKSNNAGVIVTGALSIICVLLIGLNVFQFVQGSTIKDELITAKTTIAEQEEKIATQKQTIAEKRAKISELERDIGNLEWTQWISKSKVNFLDEHIVIVGDSNNTYHKYGCSDLDLSYFYAFNVENARAQGYKACSKCN